MAKFEEALNKLETIVQQLEKGELSLEDSVRLFEQGVQLSTACRQELDSAEGRVQKLIAQRDGALSLEAFESEE
jgi:exodeoxyribonuclease VII small subunit